MAQCLPSGLNKLDDKPVLTYPFLGQEEYTMKANQKFANADEAVSPVIGVILMVAITVVLAAVVFVLVNNLTGDTEAGEDVAFLADSPRAEVVTISMITEGANAPYELDTSADGPNDLRVTLNEGSCTYIDAATTNDYTVNDEAAFASGDIISFDFSGTADDRCGAGDISSGDEITITITVRGQVKFSENVVVR